ncbi:unnamed protein product [Chilo suppressalis]|uniref:Fucosyltransferase N-terminal domain-containing protein n=1 Tax=Chilo suppressalis TaxID=168631 RepID=A0ABN8AR61_CHISP|nr:unnamed protein product [Chilo suppressalis]
MYFSVCLVICFAVPGGCEINISAWEWEAEPHERIVARYFLRRQGCSVSDCAYTQDASRLADADAVLVVLDASGDTPPTRAAARHPRQRWVFAATGSPLHTIPSSMIAGLAGLFNWSMTYRSDADVPIPYGRTLALVAPPPVTSSSVSLPALVPHWRRKRRDVLAAALLSNCRARDRMRALNALQRYMRLHYYGNCFYRRPSQEFHAWRRHFVVSVEDAWEGARGRLCRLCEALQYNARQPRLYDEDDLRRFLDPHVRIICSKWESREKCDENVVATASLLAISGRT